MNIFDVIPIKRPHRAAKGTISGELLREVRALAPGDALQLTAAGSQLAILSWDDFEHIMELADMCAQETETAPTVYLAAGCPWPRDPRAPTCEFCAGPLPCVCWHRAP